MTPGGRAAARPSHAELEAAGDKTIEDVLGPSLDVLFCGINPGLYSAATGHHFARPGNRFWPALYRSGFTPRLLSPAEQDLLPSYGLGITNVVRRPSAQAAELSAEEFRAGGERLVRLVAEVRPKVLAVAGVTAYRQAFGVPKAVIGPQEPDRWRGGVGAAQPERPERALDAGGDRGRDATAARVSRLTGRGTSYRPGACPYRPGRAPPRGIRLWAGHPAGSPAHSRCRSGPGVDQNAAGGPTRRERFLERPRPRWSMPSTAITSQARKTNLSTPNPPIIAPATITRIIRGKNGGPPRRPMW